MWARARGALAERRPMSVQATKRGSGGRRSWFPWSTAHDTQHPALAAMRDQRTPGERVADAIARFGGSWPFIFMFLGLIAAWMVLNTVLLAHVLHHKQFDAYPYIALNLML